MTSSWEERIYKAGQKGSGQFQGKVRILVWNVESELHVEMLNSQIHDLGTREDGMIVNICESLVYTYSN